MSRSRFLVAITFLCPLLFLEPAFGQLNLLSNGGFETSGFSTPWNSASSPLIGNSTIWRIEGGKSAVFDHGGSANISGLSQLVPVGTAPNTVIVGRSYILSANIRFAGTSGDFRLIGRSYQGGSYTDATDTFGTTSENWEKVQIRFTVPAGTTSFRVFCRCEGTIGKTWVDAVELIETGGGGTSGANLLANEDFEGGTSSPWNLVSGATIDSSSSRFGSNSLKLVGNTSTLSYASQFIDLTGRGFDPDKPIYTISAHIKTTGSPPSPVTNVDWDTTGVALTPVPGVGACIKIDCYNGSTHLRSIATPFFFSKASVYTEREFSFLVPEGTTSIIVTPFLSKHSFTAWFDNFRLTQWEVDSSLTVEATGVEVVEAPEAGTYVAADPTAGIQDAIDEVSDTTEGNYGKVIWAQEGDYFHQHLLVPSTTHLKMHQDALLTRNQASGNTMWSGGHIKSPAWGDPVSDVIIEGGFLDNHFGSNVYPGSAVAFFGDRIVVRNVYIPRYSKVPDSSSTYSASAILFCGHDMYVYNNFVSGPKSTEGHDGLHYWGGARAHIFSNQVLAGDDGLGIFSATQSSVYKDRNIDAVEAYNNILDSVGARAAALGIATARLEDYRMLSRVTNVRLRNFTGLCGGESPVGMLAIICAPAHDDYSGSSGYTSDAQVEEVLIENADLQGYEYQNSTTDPYHPDYTGGSLDETTSYPPIGVKIFTFDVGWVKDVWYENVSVRNFKTTNSIAVQIIKGESDTSLQEPNSNIRFKYCTIDQPSGDQAAERYFINGIKWTEVGVLEHALWYNDLYGPGSGIWTDYQ